MYLRHAQFTDYILVAWALHLLIHPDITFATNSWLSRTWALLMARHKFLFPEGITFPCITSIFSLHHCWPSVPWPFCSLPSCDQQQHGKHYQQWFQIYLKSFSENIKVSWAPDWYPLSFYFMTTQHHVLLQCASSSAYSAFSSHVVPSFCFTQKPIWGRNSISMTGPVFHKAIVAGINLICIL